MQGFIKFISILLIMIGLTGCDGSNDASAVKNVSLLSDAITFSLPADAGFVNKSDKAVEKTGTYIYLDKTGQKSVIILLTPGNDNSDLKLLSDRLLAKQKERNGALQVLSDQAFNSNDTPAHRTDVLQSIKDSKVYTSTILLFAKEQLMTLQISLPVTDPKEGSQLVDSIVDTLKIGK